jgi:hypothetical protein
MLSKNAHNENLNNCGAGSTLVVLSRIMRKFRNGNITGLKQMEIPELTDFLEKSWKEK